MAVATARHLEQGIRVVSRAHSKLQDHEVEKLLQDDVFIKTWEAMKSRVILAISIYVQKLGLDLVPEPANPMSQRNIETLSAFFNENKYEIQRNALCDMYSAANQVLGSDNVLALGENQTENYTKGKSAGFRVTPELEELINIIDGSVTGEWKKRYKSQVPEEAKDAFVDVITRRKDQPLS